MKVKIGGADAASMKADLLAVGVYEGEGEAAGDLKPATARDLRSLLGKTGFDAKEGKARSTVAPKGVEASRLLFLGLGRRSRVHPLEACRRSAGLLASKLSEHGASNAVLVPPEGGAEGAAAAAEGLYLADYSFDRHRSSAGGNEKSPTSVTVAVRDDARAAAKREAGVLAHLARGTKLARDLGNEPSNVLTPAALADAARKIARKHAQAGVRCRILGPAEIKKKKMGAFLAVAQGSDLPPRLIHLTYKPKGGSGRRTKRVGVVGKGITFDSGGISIKPAAGLEDMKMDMCGAAAVLGLFECLPQLGVKHEVHGVVAACDNMPSGKSYKPGDVVKSMSGRTIEVLNTDAEGRLTLVDALHYTLASKPDVMVDLATLTGACAVALGAASGIMTQDVDLRAALVESSEAVGERSWPLPLFDDYRAQLKSDVADVKNLGERFGGALTAGLFLAEWVPEDLPWAHLDIAGSAWVGKDLPYCPKGATGTGVRTLARWLRDLAA